MDRDGKARELHVPQSLASIDYGDFEPALLPRTATAAHPGTIRPLVRDELFTVDLRQWAGGDQLAWPTGKMRILGVVAGALRIEGAGETAELGAGQFCLIHAGCEETTARAKGGVSFLEIQ